MSVPDPSGLIRQLENSYPHMLKQNDADIGATLYSVILESEDVAPCLTPASTGDQGFPASLKSRGDYMVWAAKIVARLAKRLARDEITPQQVDLKMLVPCLADVKVFDDVDRKDNLIQSIADTLDSTANEVAEKWKEFEVPPTVATASSAGGSRTTSAHGPTQMASAPIGALPVAPDGALARYDHPVDPQPDYEARWAALEDLLTTLCEIPRGARKDTCPLGDYCHKSGFDFETNIPKPFKNNFEMKRHLGKHLKPHRCNLPGCVNPYFPSEYGLTRHMRTVKHEPPVP